MALGNDPWETLSTIGLILCCLPLGLWGLFAPVHWSPYYFRRTVHWVFPVLKPWALKFPSEEEKISQKDMDNMYAAAIDCVADSKKPNAAALVWVTFQVGRLGTAGMFCLGVTSIYALTCDYAVRHVALLPCAVNSTFLLLVNANHAGWLPYGNNMWVEENGKLVGMYFTPLWLVASVFLWIGFFSSRESGIY